MAAEQNHKDKLVTVRELYKYFPVEDSDDVWRAVDGVTELAIGLFRAGAEKL